MKTKTDIEDVIPVDNDKFDRSQSYLGNKNLPLSDIEFKWTAKMISEMKKAKDSLLHFAEAYFYIVTPDDGKQKIKLYAKQKRILKALQKNRFVITVASRQSGKALALDTPIPTPVGWKTMGELKDGELVFNSSGTPCQILKAHDVMYDRPCYKIVFDNGETIIADEGHLWFTQSKSERQRKCKGSRKTTKQIYDNLFCGIKKEPMHRIFNVLQGVEYQKKELPIDPYVLGLWLGDGCIDNSAITVGPRDITELVEILSNNSEYEIGLKNYKPRLYTLRLKSKNNSLHTQLKENNLLYNKHIPNIYLFGNRDQRLELLKGLIDSDGYINQKGTAHFYNTNIELTKQFKKLVESLGYKTTYRTFIPTCNGIKCSECGEVIFHPREDVCKLSFKKSRIKKDINIAPDSKKRNQWHYIVNVEKTESVPVRCLTVDSIDHLFLCGKTYIPTSNTTMMCIYALWTTCFNSDKRIVVVANKENTAITILRRIKLAYEELPNWLKPGVEQWGKTEVIFGNGSSIAISTTTGSAVRGETVNCVDGDSIITVRDKLTGKVYNTSISKLYEELQKTEEQLNIILKE